MGEDLDGADDIDLCDPDRAANLVSSSSSAARLDAWHDGGCNGRRPPGRLRRHPVDTARPWHGWITEPAYRTVLDPDGRPLGMRLRRTF